MLFFLLQLSLLPYVFSFLQLLTKPYCRIVRHHQHQIHAQQQAVQSMNAEQNLKIKAKKRAANTFIYYICMLLCYFPEAVSILILMTYKEHWNIRWRFADTILFMNSAINPFLYFWPNRSGSPGSRFEDGTKKVM